MLDFTSIEIEAGLALAKFQKTFRYKLELNEILTWEFELSYCWELDLTAKSSLNCCNLMIYGLLTVTKTAHPNEICNWRCWRPCRCEDLFFAIRCQMFCNSSRRSFDNARSVLLWCICLNQSRLFSISSPSINLKYSSVALSGSEYNKTHWCGLAFNKFLILAAVSIIVAALDDDFMSQTAGSLMITDSLVMVL